MSVTRDGLDIPIEVYPPRDWIQAELWKQTQHRSWPTYATLSPRGGRVIGRIRTPVEG